jgi:hypothetical protein
MAIVYSPIATKTVRAYQAGVADAYGMAPERSVSDGQGNPCRHCLRDIPDGADMLILAHRPFEGLHPYAETGPIFLCGAPCTAFDGQTPEIFAPSGEYLVKGYHANDRIYYGTGQIVTGTKMAAAAEAIFANPEVAYIHVRSARNNCYQARIDRT